MSTWREVETNISERNEMLKGVYALDKLFMCLTGEATWTAVEGDPYAAGAGWDSDYIVFEGCIYYGKFKCIYKSDSNGENFELIYTAAQNVYEFCICKDTLYARYSGGYPDTGIIRRITDDSWYDKRSSRTAFYIFSNGTYIFANLHGGMGSISFCRTADPLLDIDAWESWTGEEWIPYISEAVIHGALFVNKKAKPFILSDGTMYLRADSGIFSIDATGEALTELSSSVFALFCGNEDTFYAWLHQDPTHEMYKSTDRGVTWAVAGGEIDGITFEVGLHEGVLFQDNDAGGGMYASYDGGETWESEGPGGYAKWIPFKDYLYANAGSGHIIRRYFHDPFWDQHLISSNSGAIYADVYNNKHVTPYGIQTWNDAIYTCQPVSNQIYKTTDGSTRVLATELSGVLGLYCFGQDDTYLYAGGITQIQRTADGTTWSRVNDDAFNWGAFYVFDSALYGVCNSGSTIYIKKSVDSGVTWDTVHTCSFTGTAYDERCMVVFDGVLYATAEGYLLRSVDGTTWTEALIDTNGKIIDLVVFGEELYYSRNTTSNNWAVYSSTDGITFVSVHTYASTSTDYAFLISTDYRLFAISGNVLYYASLSYSGGEREDMILQKLPLYTLFAMPVESFVSQPEMFQDLANLNMFGKIPVDITSSFITRDFYGEHLAQDERVERIILEVRNVNSDAETPTLSVLNAQDYALLAADFKDEQTYELTNVNGEYVYSPDIVGRHSRLLLTCATPWSFRWLMGYYIKEEETND